VCVMRLPGTPCCVSSCRVETSRTVQSYVCSALIVMPWWLLGVHHDSLLCQAIARLVNIGGFSIYAIGPDKTPIAESVRTQ
jgi:hypothetical protein